MGFFACAAGHDSFSAHVESSTRSPSDRARAVMMDAADARVGVVASTCEAGANDSSDVISAEIPTPEGSSGSERAEG